MQQLSIVEHESNIFTLINRLPPFELEWKRSTHDALSTAELPALQCACLKNPFGSYCNTLRDAQNSCSNSTKRAIFLPAAAILLGWSSLQRAPLRGERPCRGGISRTSSRTVRQMGRTLRGSPLRGSRTRVRETVRY